MSTPSYSQLPKLLDILDLHATGENAFSGDNLNIGSPRVYGGQVLSQALVAAGRTVSEDRYLHSMHGYFVRSGDNNVPIEFDVETVRDGGSFCTRRVKAMQYGKVIYITAASYQIKEEGFEHHVAMPNVSQPESLSSFPEMFKKLAEEFDTKPKGIFSEESPIIFRPVTMINPFNPGIQPAESHYWFKPNGDILNKTKDFEKILIAYASDFNLLMTSLLPHNVSMFKDPLFIASLDHGMWFHQSFELDDWMLYSISSPSAGNARGFCTGRIYSRNGSLLASVTQEGLIRKKQAK